MHPKLATGRVGIYARYSTDKQNETSIDDQLRRARDAIMRAGGDIKGAATFTDSAKSARSMAGREGLDALLRAIDARQIDIVITEDVSRIARDMEDSANIFKRLQYANVPLIGLSDGVDTSAKQGKLTYAFKSMMAEWYIDELRERTLRGLEGRALAGFATGAVPLGFRSVPEVDAAGRTIGNRVEIDETTAPIIVRIFTEYRDDGAYHRIAHALNREGVPSPRQGSKHQRFGWGAGTIRAILRNEKYIGIWRFKEREWVKVPGTNKRRPRPRPADEVITIDRPELRIIDDELWTAVQKKLAAVGRKYKGDRAARTPGTWRTTYLLSGILVCDECSFPLTIYGGGSTRYYRCATHHTKGTCQSDLRVREEVIRAQCLDAIRAEIETPAAIDYMRKQIAELLRTYSRDLEKERTERRERLQRTEERIQGLVNFIADGDRSEYIVKTLRDLEAQAKTERAAIERLEQAAKQPLRLPSPDEIALGAFRLEQLIAGDQHRARLQLQRLLKEGELRVSRTRGRYRVDGEVFPLAVVVSANENRQPISGVGGNFAELQSNLSSGGAPSTFISMILREFSWEVRSDRSVCCPS
jgi:DNA invertase Pin-like site-specific DNA recombinase